MTWFRVAGAVAARPALWPSAVRAMRRTAAPGWWRRPPFLPVPSGRISSSVSSPSTATPMPVHRRAMWWTISHGSASGTGRDDQRRRRRVGSDRTATQVGGPGMRSALVLNATFEPLSIVPARRAVCLVLEDKADLVEEEPDAALHSASLVVPVPLVVRLRYLVKVPYHRRTSLSRRAVFARDGHRCSTAATPRTRSTTSCRARAAVPTSGRTSLLRADPATSASGTARPTRPGCRCGRNPASRENSRGWRPPCSVCPRPGSRTSRSPVDAPDWRRVAP